MFECNKIPYPDKKAALKEARIQTANMKHFKRPSLDRMKNKKLRPYFHDRCGFWHLTTRKQR